MTILLRTIHGSHLYGLSNLSSDLDYFEVYENRPKYRARYAKQTIKDDVDTTKMDLSTFMFYASKGVPQVLETMYSRECEIDILPLRYTFFPNYWMALSTYRRTITALYAKGEELDDNKFKRHAHRLKLNMDELAVGRAFNPTLSESQIEYINSCLQKHPLEDI